MKNIIINTCKVAIIAGICIQFNGCIPKKEIKPRVNTGTWSFYSNYSDYLGTVTVTVDGTNIKSFSNTYSYCGYGSSYSSYYYTLSTGTHTYVAQTSDKLYKWSGSTYIYTDDCSEVQLSKSTGTYNPGTSTTPTTSGSNIITDSGGLTIDLKWTIPGTSSPTSYADFDMEVENSSFLTYSSASNGSSSFENINFPTSGSSSSLSNGTYYVAIKPYSLSSSYSVTYYLTFQGVNTLNSYTIYPTRTFSTFSSGASYTQVVKIVKSGNTYTITSY